MSVLCEYCELHPSVGKCAHCSGVICAQCHVEDGCCDGNDPLIRDDGRYDITGLCEDEDGSRFVLGRVEVTATTPTTAEHAAWEELWDPRLTSAGCLFRIRFHPVADLEVV